VKMSFQSISCKSWPFFPHTEIPTFFAQALLPLQEI